MNIYLYFIFPIFSCVSAEREKGDKKEEESKFNIALTDSRIGLALEFLVQIN